MYLKNKQVLVTAALICMAHQVNAESALKADVIVSENIADPSTIAMLVLGVLTLVFGRFTNRFNRD